MTMYFRLFVAAAVVAGLTAFSPAPFPRVDRKKAIDDNLLIQGTYKLVEQGRPNLGGGRIAFIRRVPMKVQIQNGKFVYLQDVGNDFRPTTTYDMKLNTSGAPRQIDMSYNTGDYTVTMKGIYKIEGNKLTILYVNTITGARINMPAMEGMERPTSFDTPSPNAMILTLEKE